MKNIFWIIAAAFAFVACSDDDGPREKPFDGEVVSFEASEHLLDAMTGNDVKLGPVTMSLMGMGDIPMRTLFVRSNTLWRRISTACSFPLPTRISFSTPIIHRYTTGGAVSGFRKCPTGMRPLPPASSSSPCGRKAEPTQRKPMPYFTIPTRRRKCIPNT